MAHSVQAPTRWSGGAHGRDGSGVGSGATELVVAGKGRKMGFKHRWAWTKLPMSHWNQCSLSTLKKSEVHASGQVRIAQGGQEQAHSPLHERNSMMISLTGKISRAT